MSNPTFRHGPISFDVKTDVKRFRLVALDSTGVAHAAAAGPVFGAVTEDAYAPSAASTNMLAVAKPGIVAVHIGGVVPLETAGTASDIAQGATVYAAADGKVAASGDVAVGIAVRDGSGSTVKTLLTVPAVAGEPETEPAG